MNICVSVLSVALMIGMGDALVYYDGDRVELWKYNGPNEWGWSLPITETGGSL